MNVNYEFLLTILHTYEMDDLMWIFFCKVWFLFGEIESESTCEVKYFWKTRRP